MTVRLKCVETVKTTKTVTIELNEETLLAGIEKALGLEHGESIESMRFHIPGGGDYSNMAVDVDTLTLSVVVSSTKTREYVK